MSDTLKNKTIQAIVWSGLERFGQQGVQFLIGVILARLLLPEQFGLIAMLMIFLAIAESFINSGFGQALIQKHDTNYTDECSIFYFNIFVGMLAAGLLCLVAPWIADFYKQPMLIPLARILSLNLIINSFGLLQTTLLTRHIDFKTQLKVSLISTVLSGLIGVGMAFNGFGVWSLVVQSISSNLCRTILLWFFNAWRPSFIFSFISLRGMFTFGSYLLFSGLLDTIFKNIYVVVIGKLFSPADLGFYSRAKSLQELPVFNISTVFSRVTFPVFSSIQEDKPRLKRGVRKALTTIVMITFPMMIGLAIVAKSLVYFLLTEKWAPCVPYLQLLCVVGALYPIHVINLNVLMAQGRSDLFLRLEILKKLLVLIAIAITYRWGIEAMIYGQIVTSFLAYFINAHYTRKILDYSIKEQIQDIVPYLMLSGIMGGFVYSCEYMPIGNQTILLFVKILTGGIFYTLLCYYFKFPAFMEVFGIAKSAITNHRYFK